jgi:tryptophanyl-tRNA synthetase
MVTPLGWLLRVATFKEKVKFQPHNVNYGLVGYPVLMTSDIILYKADTVPVGEDQLPHLELAREIVRRFHFLFGEIFPEPKAKLTNFPLVTGLDGERKMSKTYDNQIELAATPEETRARIMTAFTDPARQRRSDPGHPELCNIYRLHHFFNEDRVQQVAEQCSSAAIGCVDCKTLLAEGVNRQLAPFRERRKEIAGKTDFVDKVLREGASQASEIASETIKEVREKMGLP